MSNDIKQDAEKRMQKSVESLRHEMSKIRTGRASPAILDHVRVDYYGNLTPLNQVANVSVADARMLSVIPFEKTMMPVIEKAILTSDLGLNPAPSGNMIRVPMPPLSEERRKEMIKIVRAEAEQGRISVRNVRRDANQQLKEYVKEKLISEDEERRASESVQKLTDKFVAEIDAFLVKKEDELLEI
ncbi:MAG: ribosome recycling factor [Gammaproteobacteria bacterium]|nr:ribosome recycling factor [Gammaproteobacteria bacterium]MCH9762929.1 ribosome recycling factor [Gammaproteobacteria bacterium]